MKSIDPAAWRPKSQSSAKRPQVDADHSSDGDQEDQEDNDDGGVTDLAKVR